jgi:flagellar hook-associated protein 1 FlgK
MSLDIALQSALSGLRASQAQMQVISGNISNAQTPGYSEETLSQQTQVTPAGGAGVLTGTIKRATDQILASNLLSQTTTASAASTLSSYYQDVQNLMGTVNGGNSLADSLNTFEGALQTLATTPEDSTAQSQVVTSAETLTQNLQSLSSGVQTLRQNADSDLATDIGTLNTSIQTIASLNTQIAQLQSENQPTAALEDSRDQALSQIAQLTGVQSYVGSNGMMTVLTTSGQTLVDGSTANTLDYTPSGTVTATSTLSPVTLSGVDITSQLTTGSIGALLQLRDTALPGVTAQLNQFANNLFNAASTANLQTTNSGLNTTSDANNVFADVNLASGVDNASTITVNPSLAANPGLLDTGTSGNDQTISQTLNSQLQNSFSFGAAGTLTPLTTTLGQYAAQIIGQAATTASNAQSNSTYQTSLQTQLSAQLSSVTGVNLDTELSNLVVYQNAYGASARVVTTLQSMYDTLIKM